MIITMTTVSVRCSADSLWTGNDLDIVVIFSDVVGSEMLLLFSNGLFRRIESGCDCSHAYLDVTVLDVGAATFGILRF